MVSSSSLALGALFDLLAGNFHQHFTTRASSRHRRFAFAPEGLQRDRGLA